MTDVMWPQSVLEKRFEGVQRDVRDATRIHVGLVQRWPEEDRAAYCEGWSDCLKEMEFALGNRFNEIARDLERKQRCSKQH